MRDEPTRLMPSPRGSLKAQPNSAQRVFRHVRRCPQLAAAGALCRSSGVYSATPPRRVRWPRNLWSGWLMLQVCRHFAAVLGKLKHDLLVQPNVHGG